MTQHPPNSPIMHDSPDETTSQGSVHFVNGDISMATADVSVLHHSPQHHQQETTAVDPTPDDLSSTDAQLKNEVPQMLRHSRKSSIEPDIQAQTQQLLLAGEKIPEVKLFRLEDVFFGGTEEEEREAITALEKLNALRLRAHKRQVEAVLRRRTLKKDLEKLHSEVLSIDLTLSEVAEKKRKNEEERGRLLIEADELLLKQRALLEKKEKILQEKERITHEIDEDVANSVAARSRSPSDAPAKVDEKPRLDNRVVQPPTKIPLPPRQAMVPPTNTNDLNRRTLPPLPSPPVVTQKSRPQSAHSEGYRHGLIPSRQRRPETAASVKSSFTFGSTHGHASDTGGVGGGGGGVGGGGGGGAGGTARGLLSASNRRASMLWRRASTPSGPYGGEGGTGGSTPGLLPSRVPTFASIGVANWGLRRQKRPSSGISSIHPEDLPKTLDIHTFFARQGLETSSQREEFRSGGEANEEEEEEELHAGRREEEEQQEVVTTPNEGKERAVGIAGG